MPNLYLIVNPVAGHGVSKEAFQKLCALLNERGIEYAFAYTEAPGHAKELARAAVSAGYACVVAVGGDGTVREVAEAMLYTGVPMGIVPCGTGNDMARPLHIPQDVNGALDVVLNGRTLRMDAGEVNGKPFINVGGLGFDVDVLLNTERYKKRLRGMTAYMLGLLSALLGLKQYRIRVETPESAHEYKSIIAVVANGTHFGGGMNVAPLADPADGFFDVCVAHDVNKLTVLGLLPRFVKGKHLGLKHIDYYKASAVTVTSTPPARVQVDGEVIETTPAVFKLLPGALLVKAGE